MPIFPESEIDSYFVKFRGKHKKLHSSPLPVNDSLTYDLVKSAMLHVYELVLEEY